MVQFWNVLYEKVLLEFMYVNKLNWAVPKLEVTKDNCSVLSSEDASRDDNSVPVNGDNERSKKSNSTTSFSDSFNFSPSSLSIEVEVEIEADRKQIIPLGGTYNDGLLTVMLECMCVMSVRLVCDVCVLAGVCVYVCMDGCAYVCICVCVCVCMCSVCVCMCVWVFVCMCICMWAWFCTLFLKSSINIISYVCKHLYYYHSLPERFHLCAY